MKKRILSLALVLLAVLAPAASAGGVAASKPVIDPQKLEENLKTTKGLPSLHEIYQDEFLISTPFNATFANNTYFPVLQHHYNAVWMGNAMKPESLAPSKGVYRFTEADKLVRSARNAGIAINGHTLIWHSQSPNWLNKNSNGTPLTRAEALQNMTDFINTIAGHYAGQVMSWDVVNEVFNDIQSYSGDWRGALRQTGQGGAPWYQAFANGAKATESGADYIEAAFRLAREADPDAVLYVNDYNLNNQFKAAAVADMVKEINDKWLAEGHDRLLIEGVGMQGHYDIYISIDDVERSIRRFAALGVEISISEMELSIYGWNVNPDWKMTPTQELYEKQAEVYAKLMILFKKYSENMQRINCNGIYLPDAWINYNYPTLFDENGSAKLAYFAAADPERYLAGLLDTEEERVAWVQAYNSGTLQELIIEAEAPNLDSAGLWARDDINRAFQLGILPESLQGEYDTTITRAEYCALTTAFYETVTGQEITALADFLDTSDLSVRKMAGLGIVSGSDGKSFDPDGAFTREMVAMITANLLRAMDISLPAADATFADIQMVAPYARDAVGRMQAAGVMSGTGGSAFEPEKQFARQQGIAQVLKLYDMFNN